MSKMRYLFALSVFIISCFLSIGVIAKKLVTIAIIGGVSPHLYLNQPAQKLVEGMIIFWQNELAHLDEYKNTCSIKISGKNL